MGANYHRARANPLPHAARVSLSDEAGGALRAVSATLFGFDRRPLVKTRLVIDGELPELIMFEGEPFLRELGQPCRYRQVRPYRVDASQVEASR